MDVAVAANADPEHIVSQSRTALGIGDEMVEVEPYLVGTSRCGAAPSLSSQDFPLLSFGGVSVARIEADSFVLNRREGVFQGFEILGIRLRGG